MVNIKTEFPRGIWIRSLAQEGATAHAKRAPGPGQKPQASSTKLLEPQAASIKPQAQRLKLQAASSKLLDHGSLEKVLGYSDQGTLPR
jgi:hypothetical protein